MAVEIRKITVDDPVLVPYLSDTVRFSTELWAGFWDGELAMLWGIVPGSLLSDTAYVWSITTDVIRRCPRALLRHSRQWLREMSKDYSKLVGLCNRSTTYVEHLGAEFSGDFGGYARFEIKV